MDPAQAGAPDSHVVSIGTARTPLMVPIPRAALLPVLAAAVLGFVVGTAVSAAARRVVKARAATVALTAQPDPVASRVQRILATGPQYERSRFLARGRSAGSVGVEHVVAGDFLGRLLPEEEVARCLRAAGITARPSDPPWDSFAADLWRCEEELAALERSAADMEDERFFADSATRVEAVAFCVRSDGRLVLIRQGELPGLDRVLEAVGRIHQRRESILAAIQRTTADAQTAQDD